MLLFPLELNPSPALDYPGLMSSVNSEYWPVRGVVGSWFAANSENTLIWKRAPQNDRTVSPTKASCAWREACVRWAETWGSSQGKDLCLWGFLLGLLLPNMPGSWSHLLRIILLSVLNHMLPTFLMLENWVPSWPWREKSKMETCSDELDAENHISSGQHSDINDKGDWGKARTDRGGSRKLIRALSGRWRKQGYPRGEGKARWLSRRRGQWLASGCRSPGAFLISHHLGNEMECVHVSSPFTPHEKVLKIIRAIGSAA